MKNQAILVTVFLVVHHAIAVVHGGVHTELPVILSTWQNQFVVSVIILLPIVAVVLVWTRFASIGLALLTLCMAAALIFDIYHHYILVSPDNIAHLPAGPAELHSRFVWTAHGLTILQFVGAALAAYLWRSQRATS